MLSVHDRFASPQPNPLPEIDSLFATRNGQRYLDEAREAIAFVTANPTLKLTRGGFVYDPKEEHVQGEALDVKCVATALAWLDSGLTVPVGPTAKSAMSSYGAKHAAEYYGRDVGYHSYCANGDLICAIIWRHIPYRRDGGRSPNARIGLRLVKRAPMYR